MIGSTTDLWGPVSRDEWNNVSFTKDRLSLEEDVVAGKADFFIQEEENTSHDGLQIEIPSLVFQNENDAGTRIVAILIPAVKINDTELLGVRYFDRGNAFCTLSEVDVVPRDYSQTTHE